MGKLYPSLLPKHVEFLEKQKLFFVATAAPTGSVNLSPKGMDTLRILSPTEIAYLDLTGSGNETAAHLKLSDRITIMCCSFSEEPLILRLRCKGQVIEPSDPAWEEWSSKFPRTPGSRQVIRCSLLSVQTSCGFAVPIMEFKEERPLLVDWARGKGTQGIRQYWADKNTKSIDGFDTGMNARLESDPY